MRLLSISIILLLFLAGPGTQKVVQDAHAHKDGNPTQGQAKIEPEQGFRVGSQEAKTDTQDSGNHHQQETKDRVYTVKIQPSLSDWWYRAYVIATIFGVVAGLAGIGLIWHQTRFIRGQLAEMQAAGKQTDSLIRQVSVGAEAAKDNAAAALKIAEATDRNAEAARLTAENIVHANRAYVDAEFVPGEGASWSLCATNHGRTPAYLDIYTLGHHYVEATLYQLPENFRDVQKAETSVIINGMLPPGQRLTLRELRST